jgi:hypothetical protein
VDETGIPLSVLNSLKVLVGRHELKAHRGAGVKQTLITGIECVSADGRYLNPLIIWHAATHRSTWSLGQLILPRDDIMATPTVDIQIQ